MTAKAITDIISHSNSKKVYAKKGDFIEVQQYGITNFNERIYLCNNNGVRFFTLESKILISDAN